MASCIVGNSCKSSADGLCYSTFLVKVPGVRQFSNTPQGGAAEQSELMRQLETGNRFIQILGQPCQRTN
jgi:hypothetical protein